MSTPLGNELLYHSYLLPAAKLWDLWASSLLMWEWWC